MSKQRVSDNQLRTYVALAQSRITMRQGLNTLDEFALDLIDARAALAAAEQRVAELEADHESKVKAWPPPEAVEDIVRVLAFDSQLKEWHTVECWPNDDWDDIQEAEGPYSHWMKLPREPKPIAAQRQKEDK